MLRITPCNTAAGKTTDSAGVTIAADVFFSLCFFFFLRCRLSSEGLTDSSSSPLVGCETCVNIFRHFYVCVSVCMCAELEPQVIGTNTHTHTHKNLQGLMSCQKKASQRNIARSCRDFLKLFLTHASRYTEVRLKKSMDKLMSYTDNDSLWMTLFFSYVSYIFDKA